MTGTLGVTGFSNRTGFQAFSRAERFKISSSSGSEAAIGMGVAVIILVTAAIKTIAVMAVEEDNLMVKKRIFNNSEDAVADLMSDA
jgi:hypothetical protein